MYRCVPARCASSAARKVGDGLVHSFLLLLIMDILSTNVLSNMCCVPNSFRETNAS